MNCFIYKGIKRYDAYIYIEKKDDFSRVPEFLMKMMGGLEFVMSVELAPERKLAQADVAEVMIKLQQEGFYLQMPKKEQLVN